MDSNLQWVMNCINSCENMDQLQTCKILIKLYKWDLVNKTGLTELQISQNESALLDAYINKENQLHIFK